MKFTSTRLPELVRRLSARYPLVEVGSAELRTYEDGSSYQVIEFRGYPRDLIAYGLAEPSRRDPRSFEAYDDCGTLRGGTTLDVMAYVFHHCAADDELLGRRGPWKCVEAEVRRICRRISDA